MKRIIKRNAHIFDALVYLKGYEVLDMHVNNLKSMVVLRDFVNVSIEGEYIFIESVTSDYDVIVAKRNTSLIDRSGRAI